MSLIPFAPLKLVRYPRFDSCAPAHFDLSVCPSMLLASPRLHSRSYPRHFTFHAWCAVASAKAGRLSHWLHCISAAPAALDRYLAALPAMSLIPLAPFNFLSI